MGQIIGSDKIAIPSHSSGTITLPPSLLTLGGRQYRTSTLSRLISADAVMGVNTRYFVYAQVIGGVPSLRISTTVPSTYKLSNPTAKLVTAFYSNGISTPAFGDFVNIYGVPKTNFIQGGTLEVTGSGSNPTKGTTVVDFYQWMLNGSEAIVEYFYKQSAAGTIGSGYYMVSTPGNIDINSAYVNFNTDPHSGVNGTHQSHTGTIGWGEWGNATANSENSKAIVQAVTTSKIRVWHYDGNTGGASHVIGGWGSNFFAFSNNATMSFFMKIQYHASGLTNRQLVDL